MDAGTIVLIACCVAFVAVVWGKQIVGLFKRK